MDLTKEILKSFTYLDFIHGGLEKYRDKVVKHQHLFKDVTGYTSGGHVCHMFILLHDNRIISLHFDSDTAEISCTHWRSIQSYIDAGFDYKEGDDTGAFGWESVTPGYEKRYTSIDTWETLLNK